MNDTNRSLNEVPALIQERRRYEQWLAALDARRDTTPQHVIERVKADYQGRLQRVQEQLALHRQSILEERASVESRRSLIEAEEQLRRDERSELELRSHVGELAGAEADGAFRAVDDALEQLAHERKQLEARIEELEELLELRATPPTAPHPPAPAPANVRSNAPAAGAAAHAAPPPPPERPPQHAAPRPDERPQARAGGQPENFDELAFLSEVVEGSAGQPGQPGRRPGALPGNGAGQASQVITRDEAAAEALARSLRASVEAGTAERPLAANVTSNTPLVLRPVSGGDQSKTLKCGECGAVNYPTEWYCERCGAELAAL